MSGEWVERRRWLGAGRGAPAGSHALAENDVVRLPRGGAVRVEVGQVVVTREGDPIDHVLEAGDTLELAARGRAVAWALAASRIMLERPVAR
jgi:hypothetical protein